MDRLQHIASRIAGFGTNRDYKRRHDYAAQDLRWHKWRMDQLMQQGMSREKASKQAYEELRKLPRSKRIISLCIADKIASREQVTIRGRSVTLLVDPTPRQVLSLYRSTEAVRGFLYGTERYIWDAERAIHYDVSKELLGLTKDEYLAEIDGSTFSIYSALVMGESINPNDVLIDVGHDIKNHRFIKAIEERFADEYDEVEVSVVAPYRSVLVR